MSGPLGTSTKPAVEAVQVWVRLVNDHGGVNGHPVRLVTADDGGDPARHRAQVQEMVERDHVIAFVANQDPLSGEQSVAYHNKVRVPVIGSPGSGQYFYESPMFFPAFAHAYPLFKAWLAATAQQLLPEGKTTLAVMACHEATDCQKVDALWGGGYAAEVGFKLVYRAKSSIAQPDYTAECLNAKSAGAEVFWLFMDANSVSRIVTACSRQGYRPTYAIPLNGSTPAHLNVPDFEGAVIASQAFPWFVSDTPATAEFQAALARYRPSAPAAPQHSVGWTAAKLFERAAARMPEPPTAAAVLEGLWGVRGDDLGGLTYDLNFTREQPATERICWFKVRIRSARFAALEGAKHYCR